MAIDFSSCEGDRGGQRSTKVRWVKLIEGGDVFVSRFGFGGVGGGTSSIQRGASLQFFSSNL